ncbi:uncharacterized protein [Macrobrachium rosenbergii]|uniref:uncharacterized protein n=1 Tax=Macrobrachium rosenbergii TaxID=79674 RepID=UPI0034D69239
MGRIIDPFPKPSPGRPWGYTPVVSHPLGLTHGVTPIPLPRTKHFFPSPTASTPSPLSNSKHPSPPLSNSKHPTYPLSPTANTPPTPSPTANTPTHSRPYPHTHPSFFNH